jgi:transcription elongation factor Elf1
MKIPRCPKCGDKLIATRRFHHLSTMKFGWITEYIICKKCGWFDEIEAGRLFETLDSLARR